MTEPKKIIFLEIGKLKDGHQAVFSKRIIEEVPHGEGFLKQIERYFKDDCLPGKRTNLCSLDIEAESGHNVYVIRLCNDDDGDLNTNTLFGPALPPVSPIISNIPMITRGFGSSGVCYTDQNGDMAVLDGNTIPEEIEKMPRNNWAFFSFDTSCIVGEIRSHKSARWASEDHVHLPVYMNLFDINSTLPAWLAGNHNHDEDGVADTPEATGTKGKNHDHENGLFGHKGVHLASAVSYIDVEIG